MKNILILLSAAVMLVSCKSTMIYNHTTVQDIFGLKKGMSMQDVNTSLKVLPYEFYTNFEDGNKVLAYKYKKTYQKVTSGSEIKKLNGESLRYKDDDDLFVIFDQKNDDLLYYITNTGRKSAKGILANSNKLNLIKTAPLLFDNSNGVKSSKISLKPKNEKKKLFGLSK